MADVEINLDKAALEALVFDKRVAKELLVTAKQVGLTAYNIAPKRYPLHEYAASIKEEIEITDKGPVAYVHADTDAVKIEFGTEDTPRFRPLGKALERNRIK
ncbi:hypothetical protein [Nonomuraea roseola]|uniref:Uncharacterized protein n=1 Tax=Nonomuraea roseola TaxID=46179 RepID=A0ABV5Q192_9ACTN